jgi:hypothetical protein
MGKLIIKLFFDLKEEAFQLVHCLTSVDSLYKWFSVIPDSRAGKIVRFPRNHTLSAQHCKVTTDNSIQI